VSVAVRASYGMSETGRMLHIPKSTVHRWVSGWKSSGRQHAPLLNPVGGRFTFQDLAELSVVQQLRTCNISVSLIHELAAMIREDKHVEHPFLRGVLIDPDGRDLLCDYAHRLVSTKNHAITEEAVRVKLIQPERVRIEGGVAVRVFPFSRDAPDQDPQMVAIDPRHRFGKPVTSPSLIDIDGLVLRLCWGETFEDLANTLEPEGALPELEEGVRYWLNTMTPGRSKRVEESQHRRVALFRAGKSVEQIARQERVRTRTIARHIGEALEVALGAPTDWPRHAGPRSAGGGRRLRDRGRPRG
jgi:hypothetical protein